MIAPAPVTEFWRTRRDAGWCQHYWASWTLPHRQALAALVTADAPDVVLELGAHCGPNLRACWMRHRTRYVGIEINPDAVRFGREALGELGADIELLEGALPGALTRIPSQAADVVFSCYVLTYCTPDELEPVLAHAGRIARRRILLAEPAQALGGALPAPEHYHDYAALARRRWPEARIRPFSLPPANNLTGGWSIDWETA